MCLSLGIEPKQLRTLLFFFSKVLIAGDCLAGAVVAAAAVVANGSCDVYCVTEYVQNVRLDKKVCLTNQHVRLHG